MRFFLRRAKGFQRAWQTVALAGLAGWLSGCATDQSHQVVISVPEQRMILIKDGLPLAIYPVSTSKYGVGDRPGSSETPVGTMEIARKIGDGLPAGAAFKNREPTGEIVAANSPGRDAILSRILWLRGLDAGNQNAYGRYIYIHGTAAENAIGHPVSYGCIRMRSRDVIALYNEIGVGAKVFILEKPLSTAVLPFVVPETIIPPAPIAAPLVAASAPGLPPDASQRRVTVR